MNVYIYSVGLNALPFVYVLKLDTLNTCDQWSFRKTGTMGPMASHAEIGVWFQAPRVVLQGSEGIIWGKICDCICEILQLMAFWAGKLFVMPSIMRS